MHSAKIVPISQLPDNQQLQNELSRLNIGMTPDEARQVARILKRDPTRVELFIFDIEWSEHCSYKSSKSVLKTLPTQAGNVILGPGEDAGIISFTTAGGVEYALVIAHESHNHPSRLLPVEGAATGIGGIVRDVDCMGAHVCALADSLRFGNPEGADSPRTRWIISGVVDGIWEYGNALGVPNLAGDIYFDDSFDDNCLVNVMCLGVVPVDRIIHSRVPEEARNEDFDLILVGKQTDAGGFGGVTFASEIIDETKEQRHIGAVQVHDPFLKNILITRKANRMVWEEARKRKIPIGMKDLGGGGLACASSEICSASGFGAEIHLDKVHRVHESLLPEIIACSETQERFIFAVPRHFSREVLHIYNDIWNLAEEANGACARIIGKTLTDPDYRLLYNNEIVCEAPIHEITSGITCVRESQPLPVVKPSADLEPVADSIEALYQIIGSRNVCSRYPVYKHYDTEVQGAAVLRSGEADAGVIAPLEMVCGSKAGIALSIDGNPFIGAINPFWGGATAVARSHAQCCCSGCCTARADRLFELWKS